MRNIYIMRHGATDWNREGRLQGQRDKPLNDLGRDQARQAGERFRARGLRFDVVIASPLRRARETAALCAGVDPGLLRLDPRLMEVNFGPYEGVVFREGGEELRRFFRDPVGCPLPGMETTSHLLARTASFLEDLKREPEEGAALIVTHGVAIRALLHHLTGGSREVWSMPIDNCVLYRTQLENGVYGEAALTERSQDETQETY